MTSELSLRPTGPDDLDFVAAAERDPEASPNITARPRERHMQSFEHPDEEHLLVLEDGEPVGYALLQGFDRRHRNIEIQTLVISERDRGLGRRTLRLLLDYLFDERDAHRVWLDVVGHNARARRAYEAVGFTHEGEMREAWLCEEDGGWDSILLLSILEHEWPALREAATERASSTPGYPPGT